MAKPTDKAPAIENLINSLTGGDRAHTIRYNLCVTCGQGADEFNDELSRKEYTISGMCQDCQDNFFGT